MAVLPRKFKAYRQPSLENKQESLENRVAAIEEYLSYFCEQVEHTSEVDAKKLEELINICETLKKEIKEFKETKNT